MTQISFKYAILSPFSLVTIFALGRVEELLPKPPNDSYRISQKSLFVLLLETLCNTEVCKTEQQDSIFIHSA